MKNALRIVGRNVLWHVAGNAAVNVAVILPLLCSRNEIVPKKNVCLLARLLVCVLLLILVLHLVLAVIFLILLLLLLLLCFLVVLVLVLLVIRVLLL